MLLHQVITSGYSSPASQHNIMPFPLISECKVLPPGSILPPSPSLQFHCCRFSRSVHFASQAADRAALLMSCCFPAPRPPPIFHTVVKWPLLSDYMASLLNCPHFLRLIPQISITALPSSPAWLVLSFLPSQHVSLPSVTPTCQPCHNLGVLKLAFPCVWHWLIVHVFFCHGISYVLLCN